jgi:hypothetical protein
MEKCDYCKELKEDVKLRLPKLSSKRLNLCNECYKISDTQGFYYTFNKAD